MKKNIYMTILIAVTVICIVFGTMNHMGIPGRRERSTSQDVQYDIDEIKKSDSSGEAGGLNDPKDGSGKSGQLAKKRADSTVTKINAQIDYGSLYVKAGAEFAARYDGDSDLKPEVSLENGILTIVQKSSNMDFIKGILHPKAELTVTLPRGTVLDEAKIVLDLGDLSVSGVNIENGTVVNNMGRIDIESCMLGKMNIEDDMGDIEVRECGFRNLVIEEDLGKVIVASVQDLSGADIDLETDLGKVVVNGKDQGAAFRVSGTDDVRLSVQNDLGDVELTF